MDERRKQKERRIAQEHHYIIRVSTALSRNEFLTRINKEPMFYQSHIYDFGTDSGHPIREELSKLLANYWSQKIDSPEGTENKGD